MGYWPPPPGEPFFRTICKPAGSPISAFQPIGRSEARVILIYEARRPDVADLDAVDLATHRARLRQLDAALSEQASRVARGLMPDVAVG